MTDTGHKTIMEPLLEGNTESHGGFTHSIDDLW